jgi:hypothetical protein
VVVVNGPGASVLRRRAREVPADIDLSQLAARVERTMRRAEWVGLAGPQVGLSLRVVMLLLDYRGENPRPFFTVNPVILERSAELIESYEARPLLPRGEESTIADAPFCTTRGATKAAPPPMEGPLFGRTSTSHRTNA